MTDILLLLLIIAFFLASLAFLVLAERLMEK